MLSLLFTFSCSSNTKLPAENENSEKKQVLDEAPTAKDLQDRGDVVAAIKAYDEQLRESPNDVSALGNRARLLTSEGRMEAALSDYDVLIQIDPGNLAAHEKRAELLFDMKRFAAAKRAFDIIISHRPESAALHNRRGMALLEMGSVNEAIFDFDSALVYKPQWMTAHANRGTAYYELGNYDAARADFGVCGNGNPIAINGLGLIAQFVQDDLVLAERKFSEATVLFPQDPSAWFNLAFIRAGENEQEEAIRLFSKVLTLDSLYFDAAINRGLIHMQMKNPSKALPDFEFVSSHLPDQSRPMLLKGWAKCEMGAWLKGCLDLADAKSLGEKEAQKLIERYCK